jgi:hypothetical protein
LCKNYCVKFFSPCLLLFFKVDASPENIKRGKNSLFIKKDSFPIYLTEFDSITLNTIFGWIRSSFEESSQLLKSNTTIVELNFHSYINKFSENVLFEEYTKIFKRNILELAKAADFFDIPTISNSLVVFIAKELVGKNSNEIYSTLYEGEIFVPNSFKRNVLCVLLTNKIHHNSLHYKHELNGNCANGKSFVEKCLNKKNFSQNLDFNDFAFLFKTIGNYIIYEETIEFSSLLSNLRYPFLKLDFSFKQKFRFYIENFIDEEDRNYTMIAGGIFSSYQNESVFAQNMPELYEMMKNNQDIDIFIHDNGTKFNRYYEKIFEVYLEASYSGANGKNKIEEESSNDNYKIYQGVNAFKISLLNGDKLNFIFVDNEAYPSVFSFLNTFDFTLAKIFYSYNTNAIFVPCELFSEYKRIYSKFYLFDFFQKNYSDIEYLLINEFKVYSILLQKIIKFDPEFEKCKNDAYLNERKLQFFNKNKKGLKILSKCSKMFYRIAKYGFKSFFKNFDEAKVCYDQIDLIYTIFKTQILNNCFTKENITESVFHFLLKKETR